jgi:energy-coupling factor transporter ATP-binding protein EcfA2
VRSAFPSIRLDACSVAYPGATRPALDRVTLEVAKGTILGVMGATGSGKTTLALLLGAIVPHLVPAGITGEVLVEGSDPRTTSAGEMARRVSVLPDRPELGVAAGTVAEEVALGLEQLGVSREDMAEAVPFALDLVGLGGMGDRPLGMLSAGQRQRVALAAAIVTGPDLLVLDEPSAALDADGVRRLGELLRHVRQETGLTVVVADHDPDFLASIADRVVVLRAGSVALDGPAASVLGDPLRLAALGVRTRLGGVGALSSHVAWRPAREPGPVVASLAGIDTLHADGEPGLRAVSLDLRGGEIAGLSGPNGSGKSTLGLVLAGLARPSAGQVTVLDQVLDGVAAPWVGHAGAAARRTLAGSVGDELAIGPLAAGLGPALAERRVLEVAAALGLEDALRRHPAELTAPVRALVGLATAIVLRPRVLVLDEPFAGLDAATVARLEAVLREQRDAGAAILLICHDRRWLTPLADRVVAMDRGRLVVDGGPPAGERAEGSAA